MRPACTRRDMLICISCMGRPSRHMQTRTRGRYANWQHVCHALFRGFTSIEASLGVRLHMHGGRVWVFGPPGVGAGVRAALATEVVPAAFVDVGAAWGQLLASGRYARARCAYGFPVSAPRSTCANRHASRDRMHARVCVSRMGRPFDICVSRMGRPIRHMRFPYGPPHSTYAFPVWAAPFICQAACRYGTRAALVSAIEASKGEIRRTTGARVRVTTDGGRVALVGTPAQVWPRAWRYAFPRARPRATVYMSIWIPVCAPHVTYGCVACGTACADMHSRMRAPIRRMHIRMWPRVRRCALPYARPTATNAYPNALRAQAAAARGALDAALSAGAPPGRLVAPAARATS